MSHHPPPPTRFAVPPLQAKAAPARPAVAIPPPTRFGGPVAQTKPAAAVPPPAVATRVAPRATAVIQGFFRGVVQAKAPGRGDAFALPPSFSLPAGGGRPLPDAVRQKMERYFGADFSSVRVHVGPEAPAIGALAFTVGNTIAFAPGQYMPDTARGQQILGHELAHVVQQRAGRVRNPFGSGLAVVQDTALEAEADRHGLRAAQMMMAPAAAAPVAQRATPGTPPAAAQRWSPTAATAQCATTSQELASYARKRFTSRMQNVKSRAGKNIAVAVWAKDGSDPRRLKAISGSGSRLLARMKTYNALKLTKTTAMRTKFKHSTWVGTVPAHGHLVKYPQHTCKGFITHKQDSEVKILNQVLRDSDSKTKGRLKMYTQRPPCFSCRRVLRNFEKQRPNITVSVYHGTRGRGVDYSKAANWTPELWDK